MQSVPNDNQYKQKYDKIQNVIEELNGKLVTMFRRREEQLLEQYKVEMFKAQSQLDELRQNTNQQELKRRMLEKKEQLEAEREQFREATIYFSNKCQVFKGKLQKVVTETKDLENEIKFLNEQINGATKKNFKLKDELDLIRHHPSQRLNQISVSLSSYKKQELLKKQTSVDNSHIKRRSNRSPLSKSREIGGDIKKKEQKIVKLKTLIDDPVFKQTELQSLFMQSVGTVKQKKKSRMTSFKAKLPSIVKQSNQFTNQGSLSDFDKRLIMQDFLSRQQVKKFLYGIIFKEATKTQQNGILSGQKKFQ